MENKNNYTVYMHISPTNKVYIGITCQSVEERWRKGKGYKGCTHFNNAIKQYGWDNFRHLILFENLTKQEAERQERFLIDKFDSTNKKKGYNIENGGNSNGKHSEETKRKIGNANRGCRHTEETKRILSEKHKGKKLSEEHRKKLAEHLNKYRGWNKGRRTPDDVRLKIAISNTGRKLKPEDKRKVSESKNKKVRCLETGEIFISAKEANLRMHNKPYGTIYRVCENGYGYAYGFHWEYVKND